MATPFLRFPLALALSWVLSVVSVCGSPPPENTLRQQTYKTTLEYINGKYASIFGLVPKEGKLSLNESRVIVREAKSGERSFTLKPVSSTVRRVLEVPDELPILVIDPKPLTGKTLMVTEKDGSWKVTIDGVDAPTPAEIREADRLAARFQPDASPFPSVSRDRSVDHPLDLGKVLAYLGYASPREMLGEAVLVARPPESATTDASAEIPLRIRSHFKIGEGLEEVAVELSADGKVLLPEGQSDCQKVNLSGALAVTGHRKLEDGRKVPYNIFTDFKYVMEREEGAAVKPPASAPH